MANGNKWASKDIHWMAPGKKSPIAYSTKACSDTLAAMADVGETIQELHERLDSHTEEARVLNAYVSKGFGSLVFLEHFS